MALVPDRRPRGRPFQPGASGNAGGRPRGSRNRRTLVLEAMFDAAGEALLGKLIERALEGDIQALRVCAKILFPKGSSRRIEFALPTLASVGACLEAHALITAAASVGEIALDDAHALSALVEIQRLALLASAEASLLE